MKIEKVELIFGSDFNILLEPSDGILIPQIVSFSNEFLEMTGLKLPPIELNINSEMISNKIEFLINGTIAWENMFHNEDSNKKCEIIIDSIRDQLILCLVKDMDK